MPLLSSESANAEGWSPAMPEEAGFAADLADKLDAGIRSGLLTDLHAVLVSRAGRLVLERYYRGPDNAWGTPLGDVAFGPETRTICDR